MLYQINKLFARDNSLPQFFVAKKLKETQRAVYLYGHGTLETQKFGKCSICGRKLTHPVSVTLGIGPECGGHYWDWNSIGGYNENVINTLKEKIEGVKIDQWFPKGVIKDNLPSETDVDVPSDHKMLTTPSTQKTQAKVVSLIKYQTTGKDALKIEFPFDRMIIQEIKKISGRRYHPDGKFWSCPATVENIEYLLSLNFMKKQEITDFLNIHKKTKEQVKEKIDLQQIPGLKAQLREFQKEGVSFIEKNNGNAIIGDEMGLGKTIQVLSWLQLHPENRPAIIVVPASLKINWKNEAEKWMTNPEVQIISGVSTNTPIVGKIIIINYDILDYWKNTLLQCPFTSLILDEVHYIKNKKTKRTKAVLALSKKAKHVIGLSGTPITNRPVEFYNSLQLVDKTGEFSSFWKYAQRYCGAKHNGYGWDFTGSSNTLELNEKVKKVMIRRLKKDVLQELPDKTFSHIPIDLDNWSEYKLAETNFIEYLKNTKGKEIADKAAGAETLVAIEKLKQLSFAGKLKHVLNWIEDFLESGDKLIVMAVHKNAIDAIMNKFPGISVKVDGSVSGVNRQKAVDEFQNNPNIKLFVGNIKAAGVGLTLTAASSLAFVELPWTPGDLDQASDRPHRIGQKNAVNVYYLLSQNTIEQKIANLIDKKREVLSQVLDGKQVNEESLITELIESYIN